MSALLSTVVIEGYPYRPIFVEEAQHFVGKSVLKVAVPRRGGDAATDLAQEVLKPGDPFSSYRSEAIRINQIKKTSSYGPKYIATMSYNTPSYSVGSAPIDNPSESQVKEGLTYLTMHDGYSRTYFLIPVRRDDFVSPDI